MDTSNVLNTPNAPTIKPAYPLTINELILALIMSVEPTIEYRQLGKGKKDSRPRIA